MSIVTRILVLLSLLGSLTWGLPGCGYTVGGAYDPEIRSVYVPMFTSEMFRRDIHIELTEAVQKEIRGRTPFRLTTEERADTRLTGRLVDVRKDLLGETAYDDPRQLQLSIGVEVLWEDLRGGRVLARNTLPIDAQTHQLLTQANFAPEVGQSQATAKHEALTRLARRIVDKMETPW